MRRLLLPAALVASFIFEAPIRADETSEGFEFFEKRVRPLLIEKCYRCHSAGAEKLQGGLRLDSRAGHKCLAARSLRRSSRADIRL